MFEYKYYYNTLNATDRRLYDLIRMSIENRNVRIDVPKAISAEHFTSILSDILYDSPQYYYVYTEILMKSSILNKSVEIKFMYQEKDISIINQKVCNRSKWLLNKFCKNKKSEYEKIKSLYEYFVCNCMYASDTKYETYSIVGALLNEEAVCQGYAFAFKYLMDQIGIKGIVVEGKLDGVGHAWNIVWINGMAYHVDITAAITTSRGAGIRYDYLLQNDGFMLKTHIWKKGVYPKCVNCDMNYFEVENMKASDVHELANIIYNKKVGKKGVEVLLSGQLDSDMLEYEEKIIKKLVDSLSMLYDGRFVIDYSYENSIFFTRIEEKKL